VIFHSFDFIVFFVVTLAVYWRLPHRAQNALLLTASYVFYGYVHPWFVTLIAGTTFVDYWVARGMDARPARKRQLLAVSLVANLGLLGFFKYFGFFAENVQAALAALHWQVSLPVLQVMLPVGISFYTFQELSYTIDVYRGRLRARRSLLDLATFVAFFPQLVAGPIERAAHLLPQIESPRRFSWPAARDASFLIAWGYFKKLVVADNVGIIANKVFSLQDPAGPVLWAGVLAFGVQIYADFSAYSDLARGTARWFGIDLMLNFNQPYLARGPVDFWRRWHISLSTWFRDYVYIPLGGSRGGPWRTARNLLVTFLVSGFWHGASWNFVLWGAYHGVLVAVSRLLSPLVRLPAWLAHAVVPLRIAGMFVLTHIGWLMFRETDLSVLLRDLQRWPFAGSQLELEAGAYLVLLTCVYAVPLWLDAIWTEWIRPGLTSRHRESAPVSPVTVGIKAVLAGAALALLLVFRSQQSLDFIYFQF
jgi:D-alanyl-lipoteichoic acid acyltransferase DltB (MBOAT superfamily)